MSATANAVFPLQQPTDAATDFQTIKFIVDSILSHVRTAQSVRVINVTGGGLGPIGTVDVVPQVAQVNGIGQGQPYTNPVYGRPYTRYQGGSSAIILDPEVGDLGLLICCDRDTSNVIATLSASLPASLRRFNFADGFYFGASPSGITPTQYVQFLPASAGINVKSPGPVNINGAIISAAGEITDANGVTLGTHEHLPGTYTAPSGGGPITGDSGVPT